MALAIDRSEIAAEQGDTTEASALEKAIGEEGTRESGPPAGGKRTRGEEGRTHEDETPDGQASTKGGGTPAGFAPGSSEPDSKEAAREKRQAARRRAAAMLASGKAAEAAELFGALCASDPSDAPSLAGRVRSLIASGDWVRALEEARGHAAAHPSPEGGAVLGEALYRAGRLAEASEALGPIAGAEAPPRGLLFLGLVRVAEGRQKEGIRMLERALALSPDDRDIVFWSAGAAATREQGAARLERYLSLSEGDDADRIEAAQGTIRLYKALGERPVWVPESRPKRLELPLQALMARGGRIRGYMLKISPGEGKPILVLLDTGSPGLYMLERIAEKAGFVPLAEETVFGGGGSGRHGSKRGLLPSLSIGGLRFRDALVSTTTQEIEPTGRYHGLLGLSVFEGYRVTLDLGRERLILEAAGNESADELPEPGRPASETGPARRPQGTRPEAGQSLNEKAAAEEQSGMKPEAAGAISERPADHEPESAEPAAAGVVVETPSDRRGASEMPNSGSPLGEKPADRRSRGADLAAEQPVSERSSGPTRGTVRILGDPYWTVSGQMLVEASTPEGREGLFLFDTGAARSLLSLAFASSGSEEALGGDATLRGFGGELEGTRTVHGARLRFQGLETPSTTLSAADLSSRSRLAGVEISGFLGLDILQRKRIVIDTANRRVAAGENR